MCSNDNEVLRPLKLTQESFFLCVDELEMFAATVEILACFLSHRNNITPVITDQTEFPEAISMYVSDSLLDACAHAHDVLKQLQR